MPSLAILGNSQRRAILALTRVEHAGFAEQMQRELNVMHTLAARFVVRSRST
jgi:predicted transcriptional regulator